MAESQVRQRWRPTQTTLVAGAVVIAGFWLTSLSWWFLLLVALGTLGPGLLREIGWLNDKDEFQRRADHRAGYHAFLTTGFVAFVLVAFSVPESGRSRIPTTLPHCSWCFCGLPGCSARFWLTGDLSGPPRGRCVSSAPSCSSSPSSATWVRSGRVGPHCSYIRCSQHRFFFWPGSPAACRASAESSCWPLPSSSSCSFAGGEMAWRSMRQSCSSSF